MASQSKSTNLTESQWHGLAILGDAIAQSGATPEEISLALTSELTMLRKLSAFVEFFSRGPASEATAAIVDATQFAVDNDVQDSLKDMLVTMGTLHKNGTLKFVRDWSQDAVDAANALDWEQVAGEQITGLARGKAPSVGALISAVNAATNDADQDQKHLGGIGGLLHMLRDPEIQHGMRTLMVLPGYLRKAGIDLHAKDGG